MRLVLIQGCRLTVLEDKQTVAIYEYDPKDGILASQVEEVRTLPVIKKVDNE